ncbi:ATP-binding cassette domain-containing protein [Microbacterium sp. CFH 31415]|jgi:fructose transport system ATP-binding protein|uniref:ATP-binding cassette domain-containing protein n=1 Tax=Microbacterium sp. CFH 31415 TaxID=2921732 RepID=UPI001F133547|nr:ATP-binding cassette domain-containing protein [Microbacterium sp. CFH 31415]MCH6230582.1 ATP-binding cassette domain-containing protein [Microbacterium sp. CFH 31415]
MTTTSTELVMQARGLVKRYGHVVALDETDFEIRQGEVLAVIGDNGAGKSSLIQCLAGAVQPDEGELLIEGEEVSLRSPVEARRRGIETVFQSLAVSPALDIASNIFLGRELRRPGIAGSLFRMLDKKKMREEALEVMSQLGLQTLQNIGQSVETLSGGQRQGVAVARAAAFGSKVVILDEPTAALGVKESGRVVKLIKDINARGIPVVLISHNMPQIFEVADRIHIQRLGKRIALVETSQIDMADAVALMVGAKTPAELGIAS